MPDEVANVADQSPVARFIEKLNLPHMIAGPAGKAISRLVAGAVDIPAAYLDSFAQGIKDKTAARSAVNKEVALAAAKLAATDSDIVARAAHNLLAKEYRHQRNKEEIARKAIDILQEETKASPHTESGESGRNVDDDWLNVFERFAQDASSERLQGLWARILAGEIRQPATFSLKTLRFVSELDQTTASLFEEQAPLICGDAIFTTQELKGKPFTDLLHLQDADLITGVGGLIQKEITLDDRGQALLSHRNYLLLLEGTPKFTVQIPAALLTKVGVEIAKIIKAPFYLESGAEVARRIPKAQLTSISYARATSSATGPIFAPAHVFWSAQTHS